MSNITKINALVAAGLLGASASAHALDAEVSGHVNRALMWADNGDQSEVFNVDNGASGTRFRFRGSEELTPGVTAGIYFETQFDSNASFAVDFDDQDDPAVLSERQMNVFFEGGFGKVTLGQTDGAANGVTENYYDLNFYSSSTDIGGALSFSDGDDTIALTPGAIISSQDFESRYDTLRYDSPSLGPLSFAVSSGTKGNNDAHEAALNFNTDLGGTTIAASLGYSTVTNGGIDSENRDTMGGSAKVQLAGGFNMGLVYSQVDVGADDDGTFYMANAGYDAGQHSFTVGYGVGEDQAAGFGDADVIGGGYTFKPTSWAELYAGGKLYSVDEGSNGIDVEDMTVIHAGSRIKF